MIGIGAKLGGSLVSKGSSSETWVKQTASDTLQDLGPNGIDMTPTNMVDGAFTTDTPGGSWCVYSARPDGTNDYFKAVNPSALDFDYDDAFSISFWQLISNTDTGYQVSKIAATPLGWGTYQQNGAGALQLWLGNSGDAANRCVGATSGTDWSDGSWHHVVWTWAGTGLISGMGCYADGSSETVSTVYDAAGSSMANSGDLNIGARTNGITPFDGRIAEVSIFDRVVTSDEVALLYNAGAPRDIRVVRTMEDALLWASCVGYWRPGQVYS